MENALSVQNAEPNLYHIYNKSTLAYETIDLNTGKLCVVESVPDTSHFVYCLLLVDKLCNHIRTGKTLREICRMPDMPESSRIYAWLSLHPEFRIRYEQARKQRADVFHDLVIEEARNAISKDDVPVAKLRIDSYKWAAEKASPDYYGKKDDKVSGPASINITLHTGVLDSEGPKDILIDEFGNFKGFDDGKGNKETVVVTVEPTPVLQERWGVSDTMVNVDIKT